MTACTSAGDTRGRLLEAAACVHRPGHIPWLGKPGMDLASWCRRRPSPRLPVRLVQGLTCMWSCCSVPQENEACSAQRTSLRSPSAVSCSQPPRLPIHPISFLLSPFPFFLISLPSTPPPSYSPCFQASRQVASIFSEACVTDRRLSSHLPDG